MVTEYVNFLSKSLIEYNKILKNPYFHHIKLYLHSSI